jgi:hypothetical protein
MIENILALYQAVWTTRDGDREYTSCSLLYACSSQHEAEIMARQETEAMFVDGTYVKDEGWWDVSGETCTTYRVDIMPTLYATGYNGKTYRVNIPTVTEVDSG